MVGNNFNNIEDIIQTDPSPVAQSVLNRLMKKAKADSKNSYSGFGFKRVITILSTVVITERGGGDNQCVSIVQPQPSQIIVTKI